ncbi:MAG: TIGR03790 family protein [Thiohalocapsa sp.]
MSRQLAVVVNDLDAKSRRIARYYVAKRGIPPENLVHLRFAPGRPILDADEFKQLYEQTVAATPGGVQAYALAWTMPYRVGCMSITTAFAAGYDEAFCADGCELTRPSPYFASDSDQPHTDFGWRPTMALAGADFAAVKTLIDRGIASDNSRPPGTAYLVKTSDEARSVRARSFGRAVEILGDAIRIERIDADAIEGKPDVLFYFTGLARVPKIETNRFRPGAVADHLTSSGGQLIGSRQMSSLRWLEAGATGSYGAVVEPCNLLGKFPNPVVQMAAYVAGATLIESYWKSVQMPGQGVFIGEPLARPFGGYRLSAQGQGQGQGQERWILTTYALRPGSYELQAADGPLGPYRPAGGFLKPGIAPLRLVLPGRHSYYRVLDVRD